MQLYRASTAAAHAQPESQDAEVIADAKEVQIQRRPSPVRTYCLVLIPILLSLLLVLLVYIAGHQQDAPQYSSASSPRKNSASKHLPLKGSGRQESYDEAINRLEHIYESKLPDSLPSLQLTGGDRQLQEAATTKHIAAQDLIPEQRQRHILADSQQGTSRSTTVHPRSPTLTKRAAKARKARGRKADLERGPMLASGEEWSTESGVGSPVGGPASLEIAAWAPGPQKEDKELSELLAAHNITYDDPDACGTLLQIPKVAIMFLTKGEFFHEASWAIWFQHAAGSYPLDSLLPATCSGNCSCDAELSRAADRLCAPQESQGIFRQQHLFSVYIHRMPSSGRDSIFAGREIDDRMEVEWGSHALVVAATNMMRAALQDPLNQKFIQLSESCIPLYPPAAVHQQLLAEDKSRLDSCGMGRTDPRRYSRHMGSNVRLHWRKSSQWVALNRNHAQLIVDDKEFAPIFQEHCHYTWDIDYNRWRDCFSDEHLFPSLISYKQLGHETDCIGGLVSVDWSTGGSHPRHYRISNVDASLSYYEGTEILFVGRLAKLRDGWQAEGSCNSSYLLSTSEDGYIRASAQSSGIDRVCNLVSAMDMSASKEMTLGYECPLFARKFPKNTASVVYNLLRSCKHDLNIANDGNCTDSIPEQHIRRNAMSRVLLDMHEV